jgi:hypothetical protein
MKRIVVVATVQSKDSEVKLRIVKKVELSTRIQRKSVTSLVEVLVRHREIAQTFGVLGFICDAEETEI